MMKSTGIPKKSYPTCGMLNISTLDSLILYLCYEKQFFPFYLSYFFKLCIGKIVTLMVMLTQDKTICMNIMKRFDLETFHLLKRLLLDFTA